jgi:hypothetical protein
MMIFGRVLMFPPNLQQCIRHARTHKRPILPKRGLIVMLKTAAHALALIGAVNGLELLPWSWPSVRPALAPGVRSPR